MGNNKIRKLKELIQKEYNELFHNQGEYNQLLKTMGYINNSNFENTMAIFVQKPGARCVATFDEWNASGRYIIRGSKGALIFADVEQTKIKYNFALSDTNDAYKNKLKEWKINTDKLFYIFDTEFGAADTDNAIYEAVKNFVDRNKDAVISELAINNIEYNHSVEEFIIKSVAESVAYRLGYEISYDHSEYLKKLNYKTLKGIGNVVLKINRSFLNKVKKLDVEIQKEIVYNKSTTIINNGIMIERSAEYGRADTDRLCEGRGLSISGNVNGYRATEHNQVWDDAQGVYGRESSGAGREDGQQLDAVTTPEDGGGRSRGTSQEDNGEESERSRSDRGDNQGASEQATSGMGSDNDQNGAGDHIPGGEGVRAEGRTGESGTRPVRSVQERLEGLRLSIENEDKHIEKADDDSSAFLVKEEVAEILEADEVVDNIDAEPANLMFEQMSLFDFAISEAEQLGDIIASEATRATTKPENIFIGDGLVRDIVASGANYEARYAMFYRITRPFNSREKMVEFVKAQYKGSMKGIILSNGDKIAIYADEAGLKIAHGTRARVKWERLVPYDEILDIATELVKQGNFVTGAEALYAENMEVKYLARDIADIFWHNDYKGYLPEYFKENGYPDFEEKITGAIKNADDNLIDLCDGLKRMLDDHNNGVINMRWYNVQHYDNEYGNIFDRIALYDSEPIEHELKDDLEIYPEAFITHDFIDTHITYSGVENGKFRIRKYFGENFTNLQEAAKYLSDEYGTSGRGVPGGNGYDINRQPSKGIKMSKGMTGQREIEIRLKYTEVAKILKYLVDNDMFFSNEEEKTEYKEWRERLYDKGIGHNEIITPRKEGTLRYEEEQKNKGTAIEKVDEEVIAEVIESSDAMESEIGEESIQASDEILDVWNYIDGNEAIKIEKVSEDKYINYYGVNYGSTSAGPFSSFAEAEEMLYRHRPNAKSIITQNYKYDMNNLVKRESFAPRSRFRDNIEAITLLKKLEAEDRNATTEEQNILAKYVGWGGLQEAFDSSNERWSSEYKELRELLSDEEYKAARESVLTSFYTSPEVIKAMYKALGNMKFTEGSILEPSCGVGNFFGCLPAEFDDKVKLHGVELDSISGRIAKKLYPEANIQIAPFERSATRDNYYDVALGNVPFGDYKIYDPNEKKWNFAIHNYFFANTIKKVREGGVIAFITSSYSMDAKNPSFRQYIAERGEFLGAIRLPDTAFKGVAGTEVVSDIIFIKKREVPTVDISNEPFIHVGKHLGHSLNEYFINNPDMVLGELKEVSGRFGNVLTCADNGGNLAEMLDKAINKLVPYEIKPVSESKAENIIEDSVNEIDASPDIDNMSYGIIDGKIYYRKNDKMKQVTDLTDKNLKRLEGLINIKDCLNELISLQLLIPNDEINEQINLARAGLNELYDEFVKNYGYINNRANSSLIEADINRYKLLSLERAIEDSKDYIKADIFVKRTVSPVVEIKSCDTAVEGLAVSLSQKGKVNIPYICQLCDITEEECLKELDNHIFYDPVERAYVTADEYLSGDIAFKIARAKQYAEIDSDHNYNKNIEALEKVMPEKIKAEDISVRLGSNWIPTDMYYQFIHELLETPTYNRNKIKVGYVSNTAEYFLTNKSYDSYRVQVNSTYGTKRKTAYEIIEDSLNLKDTKVYDVVEDEFGKEKRVLNLNATVDAQAKQDIIKEKFVEWIWSDPARVERVETLYNEKFNTIRNREFDGSFLTLPGSNPSIKLRQHQLNAVARIVYGGNTLLAHVVGAGKTFEMIAAAMESKRLGLSNKPLFVVPKHLTVQWGTEFMTLYPTANILVAKETDFTPENRKKFCTRIAMGDYDAVIIGHSQFEKIPMSASYERDFIEREVENITAEINNIKYEGGRFLDDEQKATVKKLESERKKMQTRLNQLIDRGNKDDVITFEELGVDRLYVDEAHYYKNLFTRTKMRNVAGIPTSESQKSMDMYMKCQYLNQMTNEKGVIFATGTPISNSMVEMYTLQRYLGPEELKRRQLTQFDAWASTFGNTVTAMELAPEGTGYRMKTRFSKFYNLPELVTMFKQFADVKTADMLQLDVPKAQYHNVTIDSSDFQKEQLLSLADRAEAVRKGLVNPSVDNMLKITTDGRKLALDQRILSPLMSEGETSKAKSVVENAMRLYRNYNDDKGVQVIFCDMSTPTTGNSKNTVAEDDILSEYEFKNIYEDIKEKLIAEGVPEKEIAFIHSANTDKRKDELFAKCRSGEVRFLFGSTFKLGAGTNIQNRLIGLHHVDVPWRPSDIEQQEGRIIRQGNMFDEVHIFRYVTEGTFDAYSWQIIENKQKFISQIMTSKTPVRVADDVDETALSYAEVKALASGNPLIKERMDIEQRLSKLEVLKTSYNSNKLLLKKKIDFEIPKLIKESEEYIAALKADNEKIQGIFDEMEEKKPFPGITIAGKFYDDIEKAGEVLIKACSENKLAGVDVRIGEYRGFDLLCRFNITKTYAGDETPYELKLVGEARHPLDLGRSITGNFLRLDNALKRIPSKIQNHEKNLEIANQDMEKATLELNKPFAYEKELLEKKARLRKLDEILDLGSPKDEGDVDLTEEIPNKSDIPGKDKTDGSDTFGGGGGGR